MTRTRLVVPSTRVRAERKYAPRLRHYLQARGENCLYRPGGLELDDPDLSGALVDVVRTRSSLRRADGVRIASVPAAHARRLLRSGRLLSRDVDALALGLSALEAGAAEVRFGTPESLAAQSATRLTPHQGRTPSCT